MIVKKIYTGLLLLGLFSSCAKDSNPIEPLNAISIEFVHLDGSSITEQDCIDPNFEYALKITVQKETGTTPEETRVQFTVNNEIKSIIFKEEGSQLFSTAVNGGTNNAQIINNVFVETSLVIPTQGEFELVE